MHDSDGEVEADWDVVDKIKEKHLSSSQLAKKKVDQLFKEKLEYGPGGVLKQKNAKGKSKRFQSTSKCPKFFINQFIQILQVLSFQIYQLDRQIWRRRSPAKNRK